MAKSELPDISQEPMIYIDGTPNEDYPLRILRAYRQNCNCRWTSDLENPLIAAMNEACEQRAALLDKAIAVLEQALLKWKCDACGEAENCEASCKLEVWAGEPMCCPINGEECDWYPEKANK